ATSRPQLRSTSAPGQNRLTHITTSNSANPLRGQANVSASANTANGRVAVSFSLTPSGSSLQRLPSTSSSSAQNGSVPGQNAITIPPLIISVHPTPAIHEQAPSSAPGQNRLTPITTSNSANPRGQANVSASANS